MRKERNEAPRAKVPRRKFIESVIATGGAVLVGAKQPVAATLLRSNLGETSEPVSFEPQRRKATPIDRRALVTRHNPTLLKMDTLSPLSLGNGEFAFTADVTGLQTFPREYEKTMPLCTMSQWGWHTSPLPTGLDPKTLRLTPYDAHGRQVGYQTSADGQRQLYNWLRENPHRLHLGQIGLRLLKSDHSEAKASDISDTEQTLDLWSGILTSKFKLENEAVTVRTAVHPDLDLLAVSIYSSLIGTWRLAVRFAFPYGSPSMQAGDWTRPNAHQTKVTNHLNRTEFHRVIDTDEYFVAVEGNRIPTREAPEHVFLFPPWRESEMFEFVAAFSPRALPSSLPNVAQTFTASAKHWQRFWSNGAAIELSDSNDKRAPELERRVVLSQYLTAIQCAGSLPPQETGLTVNSWYGKFHLEMHWWHSAHFALWNRLPLFERSLGWYDSILPSARGRARSQGYAGARWPKMVGPEGCDSPSPIGPLLIWQQPHPIVYAELCYQSRRDRATLNHYSEIVFETAEFMASYAFFDAEMNRFVLGPPVIPAQENHPPRETWNPTFELSYWSYGLRVAQRWRERLGLPRKPEWDRVLAQLSPLPVRDGVYLAHENCPQTFSERNVDHPSMLAALGMLPGDGVDRETMRRTLDKVMKTWQWDKTWGWDYPLTAMTAARLGETQTAVDALLMQTEKNRYLPNGHNWQRADLPCYLPGNGGLLYAVAMMAGGWQNAPGMSDKLQFVAGHDLQMSGSKRQTEVYRTSSIAPGFPADGSWKVRAENLNYGVLQAL